MLLPKRVKHRKQHRGRMTGRAMRGNRIAHGDFGLVALEPAWITNRQIEAARIAMTRYIKRGGQVWIQIFPDKPITIMNAGIGGESAWDMKDRLDYDVFNRKPTYVTLTFGMNDTGYDIYMKGDAKELSEQRIAKSLESYREIEERLLAKNKIKKVLIGGSPYDETSRFNNFILHNKNNAILKIIDAQRTSAKKNGWGFVDFNQPMREIS